MSPVHTAEDAADGEQDDDDDDDDSDVLSHEKPHSQRHTDAVSMLRSLRPFCERLTC